MLAKQDGDGLIRMLRDPRISLKTKGILAYLSKCPENTPISVSYIEKDTTDGRIAIGNALKEAEKYGYVHMEQTRDSRGRVGENRWSIRI